MIIFAKTRESKWEYLLTGMSRPSFEPTTSYIVGQQSSKELLQQLVLCLFRTSTWLPSAQVHVAITHGKITLQSIYSRKQPILTHIIKIRHIIYMVLFSTIYSPSTIPFAVAINCMYRFNLSIVVFTRSPSTCKIKNHSSMEKYR